MTRILSFLGSVINLVQQIASHQGKDPWIFLQALRFHNQPILHTLDFLRRFILQGFNYPFLNKT